MKPLFSALLETIVLVVSIFAVMLCAKLLKYESPYTDYAENHPGNAITLGEALGYISDGTDTPEEAAAEAAKTLFGTKTDKTLPTAVGKLLCTEVSEKAAKVLEFYPFIVFLESILCLIFGITLPCALYRHVDPAKAIDDALVNKNLVYEDGYGRTYGYVGEGRARIVKFLLLMLMLVITNIVCTFLPVIILINFALGIIMAILRLAAIKASDSISKSEISHAAGGSGKDKYRIIVDNGLFAVTGDVHPHRRMYFRQYWNAVIAQRILECDRDGTAYSLEDAKNTIVYGDENLHKSFETSRRMNKTRLAVSPKAKSKADAIDSELKNMGFRSCNISRNGVKSEYIMMSGYDSNYIIFRIAMNCAFMQYLLRTDAKGEDLDMIAWNCWDRLEDDKKYSFLNCFSGMTDPPQGE